MNFDEKFSLALRNLPVKDYEKRIFVLKEFIKNGHLQ